MKRTPLFVAVLGLTLNPIVSFADATTGDEFHEPPMIKSVHGELNTTLTVTEKRIEIGGVPIDGILFNEQYPGPILSVYPGDVMHIKLVNHSSLPTNIHYHGYQGSPLGHSDNVFVVVKPGESYNYEVKIPASQPPGLYWYHSHIHGISEKEVMGGLAGSMVVEGIEKEIPELTNIKRRILTFNDYSFDESSNEKVNKYYHKILETLNGRTEQTIPMHLHETQLWYIANASSDSHLKLSVPGVKLKIIEEDGNISEDLPSSQDVIAIDPGNRVGVLAEAVESGQFNLMSMGVPTGSGADKSENRTLAKIVIDDQSVPPLPAIKKFPDLLDLRNVKIDAHRDIVYTENSAEGKYYIDGKLFDHTRIDLRVPLGNTEEWVIHNQTHDTHTFHIHQIHFQVTDINGTPVKNVMYRDVIRVPEMGTVTLRMPFTDPLIVGAFMYHCHMLEHEDKGMMAHIEVYDPKAPDASKPMDHSAM